MQKSRIELTKKVVCNRLSILNLLLFFIIICLFSCQSDNQLEPTTEFVINVDLYSNISFNTGFNIFEESTDFVIISNQNGEVLHESIGEDIPTRIELAVGLDEKVSVTHGIAGNIFGIGPSVHTYTDVPSNFELNPSPPLILGASCHNTSLWLYTMDSIVDHRTIQLTINGIDDFQDIHLSNSFAFSDSIFRNPEKITLETYAVRNQNQLISILPIGQNQYKSYHLKLTDIDLTQQDTIIKHTIDFEEFTVFDTHEISIGEELSSYGRMHLATSDEQYLDITPLPTEAAGIKAQFLLPPDFDIHQGELFMGFTLPIGFSGLTFGNKKLWRNNFTQIPSEIDFFDVDATLDILAQNEFEVTCSSDYDLAVIHYSNGIDSKVNGWNFYFRPFQELKFTLPNLSNQIINLINGDFEATSVGIVLYQGESTPNFNISRDVSEYENCPNLVANSIWQLIE